MVMVVMVVVRVLWLWRLREREKRSGDERDEMLCCGWMEAAGLCLKEAMVEVVLVLAAMMGDKDAVLVCVCVAFNFSSLLDREVLQGVAASSFFFFLFTQYARLSTRRSSCATDHLLPTTHASPQHH